MTILILPGSYFQVESADAPVEGRRYILEDATTGTSAQNKTFHALVKEYWKSGLHPKYGGELYSAFRDQIKRTLGAGFESFVYADYINGKARIKQVKTYDEIPEHIRQDADLKELVQGKLKSWSDYGKKQRQQTIDNLIDDATAAGVNSKKWNEILKGMEEKEYGK
jgi:uncharacterized protein YbjQ (UPF0145 family)